jgi:anti-sigma regulatory factor (Ser/Thr protein kinase)
MFHEFVRSGAEPAGVDSGELDKLELVLEELLINISRYAYGSEAGSVQVSYAVESGKILVELTDWGSSFNPLEAAPPDLTLGLADRPVGGLGVLLVRQIVGSFGYRRVDGQNMVSFCFPAS